MSTFTLVDMRAPCGRERKNLTLQQQCAWFGDDCDILADVARATANRLLWSGAVVWRLSE